MYVYFKGILENYVLGIFKGAYLVDRIVYLVKLITILSLIVSFYKFIDIKQVIKKLEIIYKLLSSITHIDITDFKYTEYISSINMKNLTKYTGINAFKNIFNTSIVTGYNFMKSLLNITHVKDTKLENIFNEVSRDINLENAFLSTFNTLDKKRNTNVPIENVFENVFNETVKGDKNSDSISYILLTSSILLIVNIFSIEVANKY